MGWRGTLRTINAATRAAAREAERRHKAEAKALIAQEAAQDVEDWKNFLNRLITIHTNITDQIDWERLENAPKPQQPILAFDRTERARAKLSSYKAGFIARAFGAARSKEQKLSRALVAAENEDKRDNDARHLEYLDALEDWEKDRQLAIRLKSGDAEAFAEVIQELKSLFVDSDIGEQINFSVEEGKIHAIVQTHTDEIVPNFRRKQLASGRLSETKMPKGEFNEIYQDFVASVAIRIGGDLFQILPIDSVFVTCAISMLNSSTGYKEVTPILSVQFVKESFNALNLNMIDPSDSLANFNHNMNFTRTKGFRPIKPIANF